MTSSSEFDTRHQKPESFDQDDSEQPSKASAAHSKDALSVESLIKGVVRG